MSKSNLKVLVTADYSNFLVAKKHQNHTSVITSFIKKGDSYSSNFILPSNRMQRAQSFYALIPEICELNVTKGEIHIDCISKITDPFAQYFQYGDNGIIMFDYEVSDNIDVSPRCVHVDFPLKTKSFEADTIKFKTDRLKVFPILLNEGFILSIADPDDKITTYCVIQDPSTGFVGSCGNKEAGEVFNYLLPLWGGNLFTINISDSIGRIYINKKVCESFNHPWSSYVIMKRNTNNSKASIQKIGEKFVDETS